MSRRDVGVGGFEPGEEAFERRGVGLLEAERLGEEFVEHVLGLGPEPAEELRPSAVGAEDAGVEGVRVEEIDPRPPGVELRPRLGEGALPGHGGLAERPPQRLPPAAMGDLVELVLVEADQRALEEGGERQVVLGEEHDAAERHQVHDRDVLGELDAVGAGDRHAARLERAVDGVGLGAADAGRG